MWWFIGWLFIGLCAWVGMTYRDWRGGRDITGDDVVIGVACTIFGLITLVIAAGVLIASNTDRVLIKGKRNNGKS